MSKVRIHLFGGVELRGPEGGAGDGLLQRPKQLALLVYLLLAEPRGFRRRDELTSLFWPESDHAHARGALRQSLHQLRRSLGPGVLINRGDEEVGVDRGRVWCDVITFEEAVAEGRLAEALDLYRGPLLRAFHVSGMIEVERWLEGERERLGRRALLAGSVLVEGAEAREDWEVGAGWACRVMELEPWGEEALRAAMRCLARAGRPVEALRAFESFVVRLREDLDLGPSDETVTLAEGIRARSSVSRQGTRKDLPPTAVGTGGPQRLYPVRRRWAAAGLGALGLLALTLLAIGRPGQAPHPPAPEGEHRAELVAVLPFKVEAGQGLEPLGEGLADLLAARLDGAGSLRSVDGNAILSAVRNGEYATRDPESARALALRFGAGMYVLGTAVRSDGRIRGRASLYGSDGGLLGVAEAEADREAGIFDLVDELARQLFDHVPSLPGDRMARVGARETRSLPALKAYLTAEGHLRAGLHDSAVVAYERAVEADTGFAMAWYRMAVAQHQTAVPVGPPGAHLRAVALGDRLSARDRRLLAAFAAFKEHRYAEAEERYRELLSLHPDEVEGWVFLAQVLVRWGLWTGRTTGEVREALERALALDPDHFLALHELGWLSAVEERFDEGAALAARMLELQPNGYMAPALQLRLALWSGDREAEIRLLDELRLLDGPYLDWAQRSAHFSGRPEGRGRVARLMADPGRSRGWRSQGHLVSARVELDHGRTTAALRELDGLREVDPERYPLVRARFQMRPAFPEDPGALTELGTLLEEWAPADPEMGLARNYLLGLHRLRSGDRAGSVEFERVLDAEAGLHRASGRAREGAMARDLAMGLRAWAAAQDEDWVEVLASLDAMDPRTWWRGPESGGFGADALQTWLRAEALARVGRRDEALRLLAPLGWLWGDAGLLAPKHLRMAELYAEAGNRDLARRHFERFLDLWTGCDPALGSLLDRGRDGYERTLGS